MTKSKIPPKAGKLLILVILLLVTAPAFAQSVQDESVDTAWVRRYNRPGNDAWALAITTDDLDNVYVTGRRGTIKYDMYGNQMWIGSWGGVDVVVDRSGSVYVTGSNTEDYATIKYYPNGDTAWVRRYNGPGNDDDGANAIAVDDSGYVYVTGRSSGAGTLDDYATIKYYPNGDTAWVRRYNGPTSIWDEAAGIAVDDSGNVYVTGQSEGSGTNLDYATIKYYSNGDTAWVRRYNGDANLIDRATALIVDGYGNVYVTGGSQVVGAPYNEYDYATIKYYPNGDTAWVRRYDGPLAGFTDFAFKAAIDLSGNVFVTGASGYWFDFLSNLDYGTVKYYPNGDTAWVQRYYGPGDGDDLPNDMVTDASGNVYVTGYSLGSGTVYDYATIKYYPNGDTAWVIRYNGTGNGEDRANAIAVDGSDNVYVTGESWNGTFYDYVTIKYVQFLCGDVNRNGIVDLGDLVYLISYLYKSGPPPVPILHAGDANCDENVNLGDIVYLITYLYKDGPAPCC
jgi:hypothetical protein